jgi:hypothetical protein
MKWVRYVAIFALSSHHPYPHRIPIPDSCPYPSIPAPGIGHIRAKMLSSILTILLCPPFLLSNASAYMVRIDRSPINPQNTPAIRTRQTTRREILTKMKTLQTIVQARAECGVGSESSAGVYPSCGGGGSTGMGSGYATYGKW